MTPPRLRTAAAADAEPLSELSRQTFLATYAHRNTAADMELYLAQSLTVAQWRDILARPEHCVLLLEDEAGLAGSGVLRRSFRVIGDRSLFTGCWFLVSGHWSSISGH